MQPIYQDRTKAGRALTHLLKAYKDSKDTLVLGLPRGGIVVAYEIAKNLHLPLDALIVRKLGAPSHEELALGAMAGEDALVFNEKLIEELSVTKEQLNTVIKKEKAEYLRRNQKYRQGRPFSEIKNKQIILVDDGIATGASLRAAIMALRRLKPQKIIIAVPVASASILKEFQGIVDEIVCPATPEPFYSVGMWYKNFPQTTDETVCQALHFFQLGAK